MFGKAVVADARSIPIVSESVQCCVTSPPYYNLRDYGTATWLGGQIDCPHTISKDNDNIKPNVERPERNPSKRDICVLCGATREDNQIGLEDTVDEYILSLVKVFREVHRVLKPSGILWVNIADSYMASGRGKPDGLVTKPKEMFCIPERLMLHLKADGWYYRSECIWNKTNGQPESVKDRPTYAHEKIYMFTKSPYYYYNQDAIRTPPAPASIQRNKYGHKKNKYKGNKMHKINENRGVGETVDEEKGANKRTVWNMATAGYSENHFASFPIELPETCILASSREGDIILDPFNGRGTTGKAALINRRSYIGTDISLDYVGSLSRDTLTTEVKLL